MIWRFYQNGNLVKVAWPDFKDHIENNVEALPVTILSDTMVMANLKVINIRESVNVSLSIKNSVGNIHQNFSIICQDCRSNYSTPDLPRYSTLTLLVIKEDISLPLNAQIGIVIGICVMIIIIGVILIIKLKYPCFTLLTLFIEPTSTASNS